MRMSYDCEMSQGDLRDLQTHTLAPTASFPPLNHSSHFTIFSRLEKTTRKGSRRGRRGCCCCCCCIILLLFCQPEHAKHAPHGQAHLHPRADWGARESIFFRCVCMCMCECAITCECVPFHCNKSWFVFCLFSATTVQPAAKPRRPAPAPPPGVEPIRWVHLPYTRTHTHPHTHTHAPFLSFLSSTHTHTLSLSLSLPTFLITYLNQQKLRARKKRTDKSRKSLDITNMDQDETKLSTGNEPAALSDASANGSANSLGLETQTSAGKGVWSWGENIHSVYINILSLSLPLSLSISLSPSLTEKYSILRWWRWRDIGIHRKAWWARVAIK